MGKPLGNGRGWRRTRRVTSDAHGTVKKRKRKRREKGWGSRLGAGRGEKRGGQNRLNKDRPSDQEERQVAALIGTTSERASS
jgi:hypothetical protein